MSNELQFGLKINLLQGTLYANGYLKMFSRVLSFLELVLLCYYCYYSLYIGFPVTVGLTFSFRPQNLQKMSLPQSCSKTFRVLVGVNLQYFFFLLYSVVTKYFKI